jgi:alpha/beta superfamily hydrolase
MVTRTFLSWFGLALGWALVAGCGGATIQPDTTQTLSQARAAHKTQLSQQVQSGEPVAAPPAGMFDVVSYESPVGKLAAYVSPDPGDGAKHPAIIWITGGECNTIGDVWSPASRDNDQTAAAYRQNGLIMMFPSLRGGNQNPGSEEGLYGEVDDVLAAADYLAALPYVDAQRIYLGGHSTGGTLALLVSECSDRFRAVFSFGPVEDVSGYGDDMLPINLSDRKEVKLRSPGYWLHGIKSPTFIIEGNDRQASNISSLEVLQRISTNPQVACYAVPGQDHFSVLAPANAVIASKLLQDTGETCNLKLDAAELGR